jgi:hypothetical protein
MFSGLKAVAFRFENITLFKLLSGLKAVAFRFERRTAFRFESSSVFLQQRKDQH